MSVTASTGEDDAAMAVSGLIMGVANERSLARGTSPRPTSLHGAALAFTYQGEALERVRPLPRASTATSSSGLTSHPRRARCGIPLRSPAGAPRFAVHAIAFADPASLRGKYLQTTRDNFLRTLEISCYSFTDLCRRAVPLMTAGGSLLTLTYSGAERVMPHYNVMGVAKAALEASVRYLSVDLGGDNIRVNAISAGPIRTLAASGIGDFRYILKWNQLNSPLKRNVTIEDVGGAGLYLLTDLSAGVTGEVHHVDCGYHVVGMKAVDAPDISRGVGGEPPAAEPAQRLVS
jgi:enoyl-[acyl-carrier protein] reductase I